MLLASVIFTLLLASIVNAAPGLELSKRQSANITSLSSAQIAAFIPFTFFASAAYCSPATTITFSCGANCDANRDFLPVASGGDGDSVQFWYVGFSPSLKTVIVAHEGTVPSDIKADVTDVEISLNSLNTTLFPGISTSIDPIEVHTGFAAEQAKTATDIISAVQTTIGKYNTTKVTTVGHSLGAAIALLDAVMIPLHIDNISVTNIGYGLPRVGNQAFANFIDANLNINVTHINNKEDLIPTLPGIFLGYQHPSGELHIMDDNQWVSCPGQDNPSKECIVGDVPSAAKGKLSDHDGPYNGVIMGNNCTIPGRLASTSSRISEHAIVRPYTHMAMLILFSIYYFIHIF